MAPDAQVKKRSFEAFVCIALFWHFFVLVLVLVLVLVIVLVLVLVLVIVLVIVLVLVLVLVIDALCVQVHGTGCRVAIGSCVLPLQVQGPRTFLARSTKHACLKLKRLQRMIHRRPEVRGVSAGNASLQK
jgi:E3 ubiquitin-protein ligase UBR1/serine/arginine repetitive matrix protein 2